MIKAVIFDMDGVIVDTEIHHLRWLHEFLKEQGVNIEKKELYHTVGISSQNFFKKLVNLLGGNFTISEVQEKLQTFEERVEHAIQYKEIFRKDIQLILNYCKKEGIKLAVASSSRMEKIKQVLKECGIIQDFELVVSGESFKESKPNPEIYLYTAATLGCKPDTCVVVEDSRYGIEAAKKAGMYVIAYEEKRFDFSQEQANDIQKSMKNILDAIKKLKEEN